MLASGVSRTGTHSVNADCTGTLTFTGQLPLGFDLYIAPNGSEFHMIQVAPNGQMLAGPARRVSGLENGQQQRLRTQAGRRGPSERPGSDDPRCVSEEALWRGGPSRLEARRNGRSVTLEISLLGSTWISVARLIAQSTQFVGLAVPGDASRLPFLGYFQAVWLRPKQHWRVPAGTSRSRVSNRAEQKSNNGT